MQSRADGPPRPWFSPSSVLVMMFLFGLLVLAFQLSRILSDSFRITILGHEVVTVERVLPPATEPALVHDRILPGDDLPPSPPSAQPEVFVIVEDMPHLLPNDQEGLRDLQARMRYPEQARRAGVEGRVFVQFVVDEEGRVTQPKVTCGIGAGYDEEAVRVVRQVRFRPGRHRGLHVPVKMTLPVTFRLR